MDTCYIIDQIKENLFDERHICERLQELIQVNKSIDTQYSKKDIDSAKNTFSIIKKKLSSQMEVSPLYHDLFREITKFLSHHQKQNELQERVDLLEYEKLNVQEISDQKQQKKIYIDQLNNISRHLNRSKKSISILDLYGNFLIYDKLAKDQFEHIYRNLEKDSFFERIIGESNSRIAAQYGVDLCKSISTSEANSIVLKYTIFSEKSRKKFNKELDIKSSILSNVKEISNLMELTTFEDIYFAYLQCLTSNVFLIELSLNHSTLSALPQKEQLDVNKKFLEDIQERRSPSTNFKAIMLITRLSKTRQVLPIQSIKKDPLFQKFQVKTKRKINKIINRAQNKKKEVIQQKESDSIVKSDGDDETIVKTPTPVKRVKE